MGFTSSSHVAIRLFIQYVTVENALRSRLHLDMYIRIPIVVILEVYIDFQHIGLKLPNYRQCVVDYVSSHQWHEFVIFIWFRTGFMHVTLYHYYREPLVAICDLPNYVTGSGSAKRGLI